MAGGLGTRMRSAVPKHLHPILGRRMVDWVLEAARPLGPAPLVVISSPESRDAFGDVQVAVQERALGTGDAVRSAREAVGSGAEQPPRPLRRHAAADHGAAAGARRDPRARAGGGDRALVRARGRSLLRPHRSGRRRHRRGDRRGGRRDGGATRAPRVQLVDLRLPHRRSLAGARPAGAAQRPGRALPHRRGARPRRAAASASSPTSPPTPRRPRG